MKLLRRIAFRLWRASVGFGAHDGSLVAAGIAYYVALSFFPLMLVLVAGMSYALRGTAVGQNVKEDMLQAISQQMSSDLAEQVRRALDAASTHAPTGGSIGFVALVVTAIAIFARVDYAFDRIWHLGVVRREAWFQWIGRHVINRFKALAMLVGVGAFLVTAMIASFVWSGVQQAMAEAHVEPMLSWSAGIGVNVALNLVALTVLYKFVPKARIRWREALAAGCLAAPLWEIGRQVLSLYFMRLNYPTAYGIIGSFLAIMLWAHYAILVVLFGAEYLHVMQRERIGLEKDEAKPVGCE